jgi:3-oxoacyl-[acyl-carrier protein] reductase
MESSEFEGRTLLLTGAAGGIGAQIARLFSDSGANLVLIDRRHEELARAAAEESLPAGRTLLLAADVSSEAQIACTVTRAVERFGRLDFVVPCAGIFREARISALSASEWRETLAVNLDAVFHLLKAVIPHLSEDAAIVTFSSIAAQRGLPDHPHYAASKGAIVSLTKSLALSLAPKIRVNSIAPGLIDTEMTAKMRHTEAGCRTLAQTPLGRAGSPSEIAAVVKFLCSGASSFMTGQILHVNGGAAMVG